MRRHMTKRGFIPIVRSLKPCWLGWQPLEGFQQLVNLNYRKEFDRFWLDKHPVKYSEKGTKDK